MQVVFGIRIARLTAIAGAICFVAATVAAADCPPPFDRLRTTLAASDLSEAARILRATKLNRACGPDVKVAVLRIYGDGLARLATTETDPTQADKLLAEAVATEVSWRANLAQAQRLFAADRPAEATVLLQKALELVAPQTGKTRADDQFVLAGPEGEPPDAKTLKLLYSRAHAFQQIAASSKGVYVQAPQDKRAGGIGGLYNRSVLAAISRGAEPVRVPVPIVFQFNSTEFTAAGRAAAEELASVLKEREAKAVDVVGHTDQTGSADYNMKLSIRRAEAVKAFLKASNVQAAITATGKGKTQPLDIPQSDEFTLDQIMELNRRVEFTWAD